MRAAQEHQPFIRQPEKLFRNLMLAMQHIFPKWIPPQIGSLPIAEEHSEHLFRRDARAILERNIKLNSDGALNGEEKIYRGQSGYKNYIAKDMAQVGSNKYTG
jgi:hypothetical protein